MLAGVLDYLLKILSENHLDTIAPPPSVTVVFEADDDLGGSGEGEGVGEMTLLEAANGNGDGCTKRCAGCRKQVHGAVY